MMIEAYAATGKVPRGLAFWQEPKSDAEGFSWWNVGYPERVADACDACDAVDAANAVDAADTDVRVHVGHPLLAHHRSGTRSWTVYIHSCTAFLIEKKKCKQHYEICWHVVI